LEYVHLEIDREIRSIGGYYKVLEEGVLDLDGREVLYVLKGAHVDTSCCGSGGMGFLYVPGYVLSHRSAVNTEGLAVSEVERIDEGDARRRITVLLKEKYPYIDAVDFA
jgi:hypothetical protein